jgi:hypothetical protein
MLKAGAIDRTGNGPNGYLAEIGLRAPFAVGHARGAAARPARMVPAQGCVFPAR